VSRVSTCIPYRSSRGCTHPSDSDGGRFVKRLTVPDGSPATRYSRSNSHMAAAQFRHCDRRPSNENRTYRERRISVPGRQRPLDIGPYRAPDNRVGDREPITDGGRVMCGLERAVDYNSSPEGAPVQRRVPVDNGKVRGELRRVPTCLGERGPRRDVGAIRELSAGDREPSVIAAESADKTRISGNDAGITASNRVVPAHVIAGHDSPFTPAGDARSGAPGRARTCLIETGGGVAALS
jgi:hypothetical protein